MLKIGKVLAAKLEEKNMTQKDIAKIVYDGWREPLCSLYESHHQTAS